MLFEPPPELQLVRSERLATLAPLRPTPSTEARVDEADLDADADLPTAGSEGNEPAAFDADADADADDAAQDDEEAVRQIVVHRVGLATPEELARAAIRDVEAQRPRLLYVARMLLRLSSPICDCDGTREERGRVRERMGTLVRLARPALTVCLTAKVREDPRVVIKAPTLLVIDQAMGFDPPVFRFKPTVVVGPEGAFGVEGIGWTAGDADEALTSCLERALEAAYDASSEGSPSLTGTHRVQLPLVAFAQLPWGMASDSWHQLLALHAAMFGWSYFERGELAEALELFRDAYWVFHLEEYQYLIGMTLERLGEPLAAAAAYSAYLGARPYAPEAATLQRHVDRLREGDPLPAPYDPY